MHAAHLVNKHQCLANAVNMHKTTPRCVSIKAHLQENDAVIVEGLSDKKAVQKAVPSAVSETSSSQPNFRKLMPMLKHEILDKRRFLYWEVAPG